MLKIINSGLMTLAVSTKRHTKERYGVARGGPMDRFSYALANALVGNCKDAICLEMTAVTAHLAFCKDTVIALCGAEGDFIIKRGNEHIPLKMNQGHAVKSGDELLSTVLKNNLRCYLAFGGGLDCGDRLNCALKSGEELRLCKSANFRLARLWDIPLSLPRCHASIRVTEGVHSDRVANLNEFEANEYTYDSRSDRMGIRLLGELLSFKDGMDGNIISEGMMLGDIQLSSNGLLMVMMADCQTIGGYCKLAHVISADIPLLAQLRPQDKISFRFVSVAEAQAILIKQQNRLKECIKGMEFIN